MQLKCHTQYGNKFWKLSSGHRTGKGQFSFQSQRKAMPKNVQTTVQLHSSHTLVKWCSKFSKPGFNVREPCTSRCSSWIILQARHQLYVNHELPDVQAGFRKGRGTRDQIANIHWIIEKTRVPKKHPLLLYWLCQGLWLCGSQQSVENSERDGNPKPPDLPPEKSVCRLRSNS